MKAQVAPANRKAAQLLSVPLKRQSKLRSCSLSFLLIALTWTSPVDGVAQQLWPHSFDEHATVESIWATQDVLTILPEVVDAPPPLLQPIVTGVFAGALGYLGGRLLADAVSSDYSAGLWAGVLGFSVAVPVGVHFGNDNRGPLPFAIASSVAIGVGGTLLAHEVRDINAPNLPWYWAIPAVQLGVSVAIERSMFDRR